MTPSHGARHHAQARDVRSLLGENERLLFVFSRRARESLEGNARFFMFTLCFLANDVPYLHSVLQRAKRRQEFLLHIFFVGRSLDLPRREIGPALSERFYRWRVMLGVVFGGYEASIRDDDTSYDRYPLAAEFAL